VVFDADLMAALTAEDDESPPADGPQDGATPESSTGDESGEQNGPVAEPIRAAFGGQR
jgi:hypothetical protein